MKNILQHFKLSPKTSAIVLVILLVAAFVSYWQFSHIQCNQKIADSLIKNEITISQAKAYYDVAYKVCMGKRGL